MTALTRRQLAAGILPSVYPHSAPTMPRPTPAQVSWQDFELGIVFHYDLPVFAPEGWSDYQRAFDPEIYQPGKLDTDQWIAAAKAMGCGYAIFTATHFNGFLQWQSNLYPYGLKQTSWRRGKADIVGAFVQSCRKAGIAPGLYLSCKRNAFHKVWGHRVNWGEGGEGQREFARLGARMTEELASRYGPLCEVWFDGGLLHPREGGPDVLPVVDRYQKRTVFYHSPQRREHRWIGNESGFGGEPCWSTMPDLNTATVAHYQSRTRRDVLLRGDPKGRLWSPAMVDVPIRNHHWMWRPGDDHKVYPPEVMLDMYYKSVGRNCNLIFGGTPDRDGLIPEADFRSYADFGREIRRRFAKPLAEKTGRGTVLVLPLKRPARIDHIVVMEEIAEGERIRRYKAEGLTGAGRWTLLAEGESIGHKRIHRFTAVQVASVRFTVVKSTAEPLIRKLAAYAT